MGKLNTDPNVHEFELVVNRDRCLSEAVLYGAPQTEDCQDIYRINDKVITHCGLLKEKLVLVNFPAGVASLNVPLDWGKEHKLVPEDVYGVLAVSEQVSELDKQFQQDLFGIVSPMWIARHDSRNVGLPSVWWDKVKKILQRKAHLRLEPGRFTGFNWFAFRVPSPVPA